jgi:hypothetical protein
MKRIVAILCAALAGCGTLQIGTPDTTLERAVVRADPRINAGLPVVVALRKVDETEIGVLYSGVSLPPGPHRLLVDCRVGSTGEIVRFALEVSLAGGVGYRLVADLQPGLRTCDEVRLVRRSAL